MMVLQPRKKRGFTPLETARACFSCLIQVGKSGNYCLRIIDNIRKRFNGRNEKRFLSLTGFTLIEIVVVAGVMLLILSLGLVSFSMVRLQSDLNRISGDVTSTLELARSKSLASEASSSYGVHLDSNQYVLFKGITYSATAPENIAHSLPSGLEIYDIDLGGWPDILFVRLTGAVESDKVGSFGVRLANNPAEKRIIRVITSGDANMEREAVALSGMLVSDSRHLHVSYGRIINTAAEILTLTFDNSPGVDVVENINLQDYISGGKFDWSDSINVGGENQILRIHTHYLNDAALGTVFSLRRDGRYNTKGLTITLSGDSTGSPQGEILRYSATGIEYQGSSIYAGAPVRQ